MRGDGDLGVGHDRANRRRPIPAPTKAKATTSSRPTGAPVKASGGAAATTGGGGVRVAAVPVVTPAHEASGPEPQFVPAPVQPA
jgi:hypothetical protein